MQEGASQRTKSVVELAFTGLGFSDHSLLILQNGALLYTLNCLYSPGLSQTSNLPASGSKVQGHTELVSYVY